MKKIAIPLTLIALLLALVIGGFFFFWERKKEEGLVLYGNVDVRQVDIAFRIAGRVKELFFEEGDYVPEGALMATLEKTPYDSQASQAKANLDSIRKTLENADLLYRRRQSAVHFGGVSREDHDNARTSRDETLLSVQAAEATLQAAMDNISYTEVRSPTEGIILSRIREPGTVVNPTDPIYILSVLSPVWIRAYVDEVDLGHIYYGMTAEILTDSGRKYRGKIGFISPMAEFTPKTVETTKLRTDLVYRLRIYAENPDHFLKQGMPVTVDLKREK